MLTSSGLDVRVGLGDREQDVQVPDHVVLLGVHRVRPVDHRVRRGPLLGEVNHGLQLEVGDDVVREHRVRQVTDVQPDLLAGQLPPHRDARLLPGSAPCATRRVQVEQPIDG